MSTQKVLQIVFLYCCSKEYIIIIEVMFVKNNPKKFVVTPKIERSVTLTVRLETELNNYIEEIARKSGRSRNELINKALKFAFDNLEFDSNE